MLLQNKLNDSEKNKISYLISLTLLFSYAEMFLPRIAFFKIGLANIIILAALDLNFFSFTVLCFMKALTASIMAGTLLSPFILISVTQSIGSGLLMYGINFLSKIKKLEKNKISIFGISICGSAFSALIQILLSSFYLGRGTLKLSGPFLLFSVLTGILTALLCNELQLKNFIQNHKFLQPEEFYFENENSNSRQILNSVFISFIIILSAVIFTIKKWQVLLILFTVTIFIQILCGRKFKIIPHLLMWLFIFASIFFIPSGKILFSFWIIKITDGALFMALEKCLKLSSVMCLSQCAVKIKFKSGSIINLSLLYFNKLSASFKNTNGNLWNRLIQTLNLNL